MSSQDPFIKDPSRPSYGSDADHLPVPESAEEQIAQLAARLDQLEADKKQLQDQHLRGAAELDNYKKRVRREQLESARYAAEPLVRDLIPVVDNLERAVQHAGGGGDGSSLAEGVTLVLKSLQDVLRQHGVKTIEAQKGEVFDPNLHEAVDRREDDGAANRIVDQWERGFQMHDRLLRPARVVVSAPPGSRSVAPANDDD
jgi:molecular chaperone GrpE